MEYCFEPSAREVWLTELCSQTILQPYYRGLVASLGLRGTERVLDYCSGSGGLTRLLARALDRGSLVAADVSGRWLFHAEKRLRSYSNTSLVQLIKLSGAIGPGDYDLVFLHYSLHDFPTSLQGRVIMQLLENLKPSGKLFIREPLSDHGFQLYQLINLLEKQDLIYTYQPGKSPLVGEYVSIIAPGP